MEVHFTGELETRLNELAARTGRGTDELVQDVLTGYLEEVTSAREVLDSRYDDLKSGKICPVDGEAFFESLRLREEELLKTRSHR